MNRDQLVNEMIFIEDELGVCWLYSVSQVPVRTIRSPAPVTHTRLRRWENEN